MSKKGRVLDYCRKHGYELKIDYEPDADYYKHKARMIKDDRIAFGNSYKTRREMWRALYARVVMETNVRAMFDRKRARQRTYR